MSGVIDRFDSREHRFLSNFWPCDIVDQQGNVYPSAEHAYQAAKAVDAADREMIRAAVTPAVSKRMGREVKCRPDWDKVRVEVMRRVLRKKFAPGSHLAGRLLMTGDAELIEGNTWGDTFWGVCRGEGENMLGKLLMETRQWLRSSTSPG